ncbi:MAG TPA: hypothetical protein VFR73_22415 [Hyphomicrobiaceae bacterium]|jgi:hypothetical protein|nr:hypothetical protein [Hyphomicrobiaceae bacterium]
MTNAVNNMTIGDLERLLDVYGSDRTRWPVDARSGAGQLAARDKSARRLLGEAEALDRVLERAPLPSLAREAALADRIIAAAQRSPRIVHIDDAAAPVAAGGGGTVIHWPGVRARAQWLKSDASRVAGLFAASLLCGIYFGLSNVPEGALESMAGGAFSAGTSSAPTLAQLDLLDEDLL